MYINLFTQDKISIPIKKMQLAEHGNKRLTLLQVFVYMNINLLEL